jgi:hypothetical protein
MDVLAPVSSNAALTLTSVETIGYIGRILSAQENPGPYTLSPYIMQSTLLLVAPALFAASIYMELGRIVLMVDGERSLFIRRTWLTKLFVAGDVLSFLMQASGKRSPYFNPGEIKPTLTQPPRRRPPCYRR